MHGRPVRPQNPPNRQCRLASVALVGDGESVCRRLHARTRGARRSTLARRTVLPLMDNPVLCPMQMLVRRLTDRAELG
jgi:hypothetical protein